MSFSGNYSEWNRLQVLLQLLSADVVRWNNEPMSLLYIIRYDEAGTIQYSIDSSGVITVNRGGEISSISREICKQTAEMIFTGMQQYTTGAFELPQIGNTLNQLGITEFQSLSSDKSDFTITMFQPDSARQITSPYAARTSHPDFRLLPSQRSTNFKYDILNMRLAQPEANKINRFDGESAVRDRLSDLMNRGAKLKFTSTEEKIFQSNLSMTDLHLPKLLSEIIRLFYTGPFSSIADLTEEIKRSNPFKLKDELIEKNQFYEFKIRQFLFSLASGMRPARIYRGYGQPLSWAVTDTPGTVSLYDPVNRIVFDDMLYRRARLTEAKGDGSKSGYIEKENGQWLIKLNLEISL